MKAGITDALVAKHIMGWENVWQPFFPSTEISDAWQAIKKAHEEGIFIVIDGLHVSTYRMETDASPPYNYKRYLNGVKAYDFNDIARCVCLVILKAKGIDINE